MPSKRVEVWDAAGNHRKCYPVDATEIVEYGGSYSAPVKEWSNDLGAVQYTYEDSVAQLGEDEDKVKPQPAQARRRR